MLASSASIRSVGGVRIEAATALPSERVSIILPVLNETARIKACLDSLVAQSDAVAEILVVDGGSSDGTQAIVELRITGPTRTVDRRQPRSLRLGRKTWGLYVGFTDPRSHWVFIDADVRCSPLLAPSLLAHAERTEFQLSRLRPTNNFPVWRRASSLVF